MLLNLRLHSHFDKQTVDQTILEMLLLSMFADQRNLEHSDSIFHLHYRVHESSRSSNVVGLSIINSFFFFFFFFFKKLINNCFLLFFFFFFFFFIFFFLKKSIINSCSLLYISSFFLFNFGYIGSYTNSSDKKVWWPSECLVFSRLKAMGLWHLNSSDGNYEFCPK